MEVLVQPVDKVRMFSEDFIVYRVSGDQQTFTSPCRLAQAHKTEIVRCPRVRIGIVRVQGAEFVGIDHSVGIIATVVDVTADFGAFRTVVVSFVGDRVEPGAAQILTDHPTEIISEAPIYDIELILEQGGI